MNNNTNGEQDGFRGWSPDLGFQGQETDYLYGYPLRRNAAYNRYLNDTSRNGRMVHPTNILNVLVRGYNLNMLEYQSNMQFLINDIYHLNMAQNYSISNNPYGNRVQHEPPRGQHEPPTVEHEPPREHNYNTFSNEHTYRNQGSTSAPVQETPRQSDVLDETENDAAGNRGRGTDDSIQSMTTAILSYMIYPYSSRTVSSNSRTSWAEIVYRETEELTYTEEMGEMTCPITMETFVENDQVIRIRHCGHTFKKTALDIWFRRDTRCPVCRHDLAVDRNRDLAVDRNRDLAVDRNRDSSNNSLPPFFETAPRNNTRIPLENTSRTLSQIFSTLNANYVRHDPSGVFMFEFDLPTD